MEKEETLHWSYTQRRKPSEGGDRESDVRKKTKGKETIGYAKRVSERIVVCRTKKKGRKQETVENMEAKNLHHGRTLTTTTIQCFGNRAFTCAQAMGYVFDTGLFIDTITQFLYLACLYSLAIALGRGKIG